MVIIKVDGEAKELWCDILCLAFAI